MARRSVGNPFALRATLLFAIAFGLAACPKPTRVAPDPGPKDAEADTKVSFVAAAARYTCAIRGGRLYCWGALGGGGSLFFGWDEEQWVLPPELHPTRIGGFSRATFVAVGTRAACAIDDGRVYCWGKPSVPADERLAAVRTTPLAVTGVPTPATRIAIGDESSCAIAQKQIYCWGGPFKAPTRIDGLGETATEIALVAGRVCALVDGGKLRCATIGREWYGLPFVEAVPNDGGAKVVEVRDRVVDGSAPVRAHGLVVDRAGADRDVWVVADHFSRPFMRDPEKSPWLTQTRAADSIAVGNHGHVCGVAEGTVACWKPDDWNGGDHAADARIVMLPGKASMVASGEAHDCGLVEGDLYCWGRRAYPWAADDKPLCVPDYCLHPELPRIDRTRSRCKLDVYEERPACTEEAPIKVSFAAADASGPTVVPSIDASVINREVPEGQCRVPAEPIDTEFLHDAKDAEDRTKPVFELGLEQHLINGLNRSFFLLYRGYRGGDPSVTVHADGGGKAWKLIRSRVDSLRGMPGAPCSAGSEEYVTIVDASTGKTTGVIVLESCVSNTSVVEKPGGPNGSTLLGSALRYREGVVYVPWSNDLHAWGAIDLRTMKMSWTCAPP